MSGIILTEEDAAAFAWGDLEGFEVVETEIDYEGGYKDLAPATTIGKRLSDGTFWALEWSKHTAHYSDGDNQFYDNVLRQVEKVIQTIVVKKWERV